MYHKHYKGTINYYNTVLQLAAGDWLNSHDRWWLGWDSCWEIANSKYQINLLGIAFPRL